MSNLKVLFQEDRLKRKREEAVVDDQMEHDLTLPQTEPSTLRTPWATTDRSDFYALKEIPRLKRGSAAAMSLHATSEELTYSHLENRGLDTKIRMSLRVITR